MPALPTSTKSGAFPLSRSVAVRWSVAAATLILLVPTFANGFPFVFWDTGTYLEAAVRLHVPWDRPVFYSIFSALLHWTISPWPIVIAQSALVAVLIRIVAKSVFGIYDCSVIIVTAFVLVAGSSLPWFVGQIIPDIFTSVLILAILIVAMGWNGLEAAERWFALLIIPVCIGFHNSNFLIALAAVPALAAITLLGWRPGPQAFRRFSLMVVAVTLGVTALISANVIARGKLVISAGSSTFLFARLLDDGPALEVLEAECPTSAYAVCSQLEHLRAYKSTGTGSLTEHFLWEGPLES